MFPLSAAAYSDQPQLCLDRLFPNSTQTISALSYSVVDYNDCGITVVKWADTSRNLEPGQNRYGFTSSISEETYSNTRSSLHEAERRCGDGIDAALLMYIYLVMSLSDVVIGNVVSPCLTLVLAAATTAALHSVVMDLLIKFLPILENETTSWFYGGRISRYFSEAFSNIWFDGMGEDFLTLRKQYPESLVIPSEVHWHPLAASFLVGSGMAKPGKVKLVTFGQPRTGDRNFSETINKLDYAFRVTHWRDIVPHIPMGSLGGYFHHRQEAFYGDDMRPDNFKICTEGEAVECSDGLWFTTSIDAHTHYFGHYVSDYGRSGCAN
ncbi:triacylglycerol lipase [Ostertagia ostertagi]